MEVTLNEFEQKIRKAFPRAKWEVIGDYYALSEDIAEKSGIGIHTIDKRFQFGTDSVGIWADTIEELPAAVAARAQAEIARWQAIADVYGQLRGGVGLAPPDPRIEAARQRRDAAWAVYMDKRKLPGLLEAEWAEFTAAEKELNRLEREAGK
jgi:hypothetical protein